MQRLEDFDTTETEALRKELANRERRALAAYWRAPGYDYPHPPDKTEHVEELGNEYVVLSAEVTGILAVYRVRNDGQLKRLKRYPSFTNARIYCADADADS